ncbi:MAG: multiheme c-type cytochrome [Rhodopirellula sp. JB055]|uniref:multiheme c-type cytochrome n=1 Tax=Rhodopirellula sp. JB055 TaxID=3342846 RepID=UPI00370B417A
MQICRQRIGWMVWVLVALVVGGFLQSICMLTTSGQSPAFPEVMHSEALPTLVGKAVCAECHRTNFEMHQTSGHASTFASTTDSTIRDLFKGKVVDAGEQHGLFQYESSDDGLVVHQASDQPAAGLRSMTFPFALGSGRNAITLFSIVPETAESSFGMEHRVSWYPNREEDVSNNPVESPSRNGTFGLTPGHTDKQPAEPMDCFGERIHGEKMESCIECHTTSGKVMDHKLVDLVPNVDCEKCHGPGSEHVRLARLTDSPPAFSVGRSDWDLESELQLCGSCHRLPRHVSPKKLRNYSSELLRLQPIGLLRSACYLKSNRLMMCSSCHNPHQDARLKSKADYDQDCQSCHQPHVESHVNCSVSPEGGCVKCHMPAITVEQGMVFHDHWIRIHDE